MTVIIRLKTESGSEIKEWKISDRSVVYVSRIIDSLVELGKTKGVS